MGEVKQVWNVAGHSVIAPDGVAHNAESGVESTYFAMTLNSLAAENARLKELFRSYKANSAATHAEHITTLTRERDAARAECEWSRRKLLHVEELTHGRDLYYSGSEKNPAKCPHVGCNLIAARQAHDSGAPRWREEVGR